MVGEGVVMLGGIVIVSVYITHLVEVLSGVGVGLCSFRRFQCALHSTDER